MGALQTITSVRIRYNFIAMKKRTIYIEFTRPKKSVFPIFSWLIRLWQRVPYSHVRIKYVNDFGQVMIFEARGTNVRFVGSIAQEQQPVVLLKQYSVILDQDECAKLRFLCMEYAGIKYGVKQVLGIALANLRGDKKNPFSDGKYSQVCSELVGRFLEEVKGWKLSVNLDIAGPREIDEQLSIFCREYPKEICRKL